MKYTVPSWFKQITPGSHGNTPSQKRLWRVVSEYVRQRDWNRYKCCTVCSTYLPDWKDGDCGHYRAWSVSNGFFKYELTNLALLCKSCNRLSDGVIGHKFGEALKRRYGQDHLAWIEEENKKHHGEKMEEWDLVALAEKIINLTKKL